jgi:hypothetical protein
VLTSSFRLRRTPVAVGTVVVALAASSVLSATAVPAAAGAAVSCTRWTSSTNPPDTIKVLITRGSPQRVATVPFRSYVRDVLPNEWQPGWRSAALQAGAVAAKQYAWYFAMNPGHGGALNGACYDVTDNTSSQVYVAGSNKPTTDAAIDATWGMRLVRNGGLFPASYQATLTANQAESCGSGLSRYPNVLSQWGSQNCAVAGKNVADILSTYYPNSQLVQAGTGSFAGMTRTSSGTGYYLLSRDGAVRPHGTAPGYGEAKGQSYFAGQTAVGLTLTPSGRGYWILSAGGGVYSFGDAQFYGGAAGQSYFAGQTAVGLTLTPSGRGYWIVSAAGGVYSYGDAQFYGGAAGQSYFAGQTAVGLTRSPGGNGYWLVSAGGGVYSYGDAPFFGSAAGQSYFNGQRAVGLTLDASGRGYWIVSAAGGVYSYGDAPFFGAAAGQPYFSGLQANGLIRSAGGNGYWISATSGGVYSYGDAPFYGAA